MPYQLKIPIVQQAPDILFSARKKIIKTDHFIPGSEQPFAQV